jgi:hypothetical protein
LRLFVFTFVFSFYLIVSLVSAQGAVPLAFVDCDKSKQNALCREKPKEEKITAQVL